MRDIRAGAWLDQAAADLTFAVRTHAKRPTATLVIIATLAIGIAATSISFSLVNGFFIRPIPIQQPERFVRLYNAYKRGDPYFTFSYADFADMRALRDVFADAAAEQPVPFPWAPPAGPSASGASSYRRATSKCSGSRLRSDASSLRPKTRFRAATRSSC